METIEKIKSILKAEVNPNVAVDELNPSDSWDSAGIDSLDRSSIFLTIEEEFGIELSDEQIEEIDSIEDLLKVIN